MQFRLTVSILFMAVIMYIAMGSMVGLPQPPFLMGEENAVIFAFTQFLLSLPVIYVNRKYFINGFKMLFRGARDLDTLIAVGFRCFLSLRHFCNLPDGLRLRSWQYRALSTNICTIYILNPP